MSKKKLADLKKKIIWVCRSMNELGINQGTSGNVSARTEDGFLITASGIPYDVMDDEHIVEMDLDGGYYGKYLPSTEWRMHMDVFKARPEAGAIVHTHSIYATALATLRKDIPPFHYMIGVTGGSTLRVSDYAEFGTQALSDTMLTALKDRSACLLANHGQIAFGPTLERALWLAGEIETLCQQYWAACLAGKPVILSDAQMKTVLARFKTYGKQTNELKAGEAMAVIAPTRRDESKKGKGKSKRDKSKKGKGKPK
jgi:L-fuculose-phosphate aldolase